MVAVPYGTTRTVGNGTYVGVVVGYCTYPGFPRGTPGTAQYLLCRLGVFVRYLQAEVHNISFVAEPRISTGTVERMIVEG